MCMYDTTTNYNGLLRTLFVCKTWVSSPSSSGWPWTSVLQPKSAALFSLCTWFSCPIAHCVCPEPLYPFLECDVWLVHGFVSCSFQVPSSILLWFIFSSSLVLCRGVCKVYFSHSNRTVHAYSSTADLNMQGGVLCFVFCHIFCFN